MKNIGVLSLCSVLVLLLGGCYAVQGDGYTHYTPFKIMADAEANRIKANKKRKARRKARLAAAKKKRQAKATKAAPVQDVVNSTPAKTTAVVVDERTKRQNRISELTKHVANLRRQGKEKMEATLAEMVALNKQAQEATRELIVLYQAEAAAAIGLVKAFMEKATQLPPSDARSNLERVVADRHAEARALLTSASLERISLERLEDEGKRLEP